MTVAVYAGSFDPLTWGHLDLIFRGARIFDKIYVAVGINPNKKPLFSVELREEMIREAVVNGAPSWGKELVDRIHVSCFEGLLVDYCHLVQADAIIRGLRAVTDFEAEMAIADANHTMASQIETVFFPTHKEFTFISSSTVKEMAKHSSATSWLVLQKYVPHNVLEAMRAKMGHPAPPQRSDHYHPEK